MHSEECAGGGGVWPVYQIQPHESYKMNHNENFGQISGHGWHCQRRMRRRLLLAVALPTSPSFYWFWCSEADTRAGSRPWVTSTVSIQSSVYGTHGTLGSTPDGLAHGLTTPQTAVTFWCQEGILCGLGFIDTDSFYGTRTEHQSRMHWPL